MIKIYLQHSGVTCGWQENIVIKQFWAEKPNGF